MTFTYGMINRPAQEAAPAGWTQADNHPEFICGCVSYERKLTQKECFDYEMALLDPLPLLPLYAEKCEVKDLYTGKKYDLEYGGGEYFAGDHRLPVEPNWRAVRAWYRFVRVKSDAEVIRDLNDAGRKDTIKHNIRVVFTRGVGALGGANVKHVWALVKAFDAFNEGNDPHGEHDFGSVVFEGTKIFWKYDYYDKDYEYGSEDPTDTRLTNRVLTIMRADEY